MYIDRINNQNTKSNIELLNMIMPGEGMSDICHLMHKLYLNSLRYAILRTFYSENTGGLHLMWYNFLYCVPLIVTTAFMQDEGTYMHVRCNPACKANIS
jgi:hypothetical protein